jgi:hypothetical protein
MKCSEQGRSEYTEKDQEDRELDIELKRLKIIKKMGWFKGRMIV